MMHLPTFRRIANSNSDIWAIGVITYFLLCGYTPFDRDTNVEEMQAILAADYNFEPANYWQGVSDHGTHGHPVAYKRTNHVFS